MKKKLENYLGYSNKEKLEICRMIVMGYTSGYVGSGYWELRFDTSKKIYGK